MDDFEEQSEVDRAGEEYAVLMNMTVEQILKEGQKALFARLVSSVRAGTASHQEAAILRNILKDNGLTLGIPPDNFGVSPNKVDTPLDIPSFGEPEYH